MQTILVVIHLFLALGIIGLVLIQHGKGADAGAAFGSGASATVFGARGSTSFLSHTTGILATLFFLTSLALAYYASQGGAPKKGIMEQMPAEATELAVPATEGLPEESSTVPLIPSPSIEVKTATTPSNIPATSPTVPVIKSAITPTVVVDKPTVVEEVTPTAAKEKPAVAPPVVAPVVTPIVAPVVKPEEPVVVKEIVPASVVTSVAQDKPVVTKEVAPVAAEKPVVTAPVVETEKPVVTTEVAPVAIEKPVVITEPAKPVESTTK